MYARQRGYRQRLDPERTDESGDSLSSGLRPVSNSDLLWSPEQTKGLEDLLRDDKIPTLRNSVPLHVSFPDPLTADSQTQQSREDDVRIAEAQAAQAQANATKAQAEAQKMQAEVEKMRLQLELKRLTQQPEPVANEGRESRRSHQSQGPVINSNAQQQHDGKHGAQNPRVRREVKESVMAGEGLFTNSTKDKWVQTVATLHTKISMIPDIGTVSDEHLDQMLQHLWVKISRYAPEPVQLYMELALADNSQLTFPRGKLRETLTAGLDVNQRELDLQRLRSFQDLEEATDTKDLRLRMQKLYVEVQRMEGVQLRHETQRLMATWLPADWAKQFLEVDLTVDNKACNEKVTAWLKAHGPLINLALKLLAAEKRAKTGGNQRGGRQRGGRQDGGRPGSTKKGGQRQNPTRGLTEEQVAQLRKSGTCFNCKDPACKDRAYTCKKPWRKLPTSQ
jgi:hypothetical protein